VQHPLLVTLDAARLAYEAVSVSLAARAPEVRAGLDDEIPPFAGEGVERRLVVLAPVKTAELRQEMTLVSVANHQAPLTRRQPWPVKSWPQWQVCAS
jgi:hypothetical protein